MDHEYSRGRSPGARQVHSPVDLNKFTVPMWDSSDPDRAPPPLPLNPSNSNSSPTRHSTSTTVAAAAQALAERARENNVSSLNQMFERSPERSPTKTPQHKRLQSLQNTGGRDVRSFLENIKPSEWSLSRSGTPTTDQTESRTATPTPSPSREVLRDTSSHGRPPLKPILGESTPPSATIMAMQSMGRRDSESQAAELTTPTTKSTQTIEGLHVHMQKLTSIATSLQKEMSALSRRSKDNATDLTGLKEAAKSRDEEIRRTLRDIATKTDEFSTPRSSLRTSSAMDLASRYLDVKINTSPTFSKSVSMPRVPSIEEHDRSASPSPYSVEGASTLSMLEKIIREMVTKEGQERLQSTLVALLDKSDKQSAKKMDEVIQTLKETPVSSQALVKHRSSGGPDFEAMPEINIVNNELRSYLQKLKDSVAQGGGITGEVKSLVRELRGEVLGMGRELGQRIDKANKNSNGKSLAVAEPDREGLNRLVVESLAELKQQMDHVIQAKRRQSGTSNMSKRSVESGDVSALVQKSLNDQGLTPSTAVAHLAEQDYDKMVAAVNSAFDAHPFEPEVKVQYLGLDRDEILACLREGLDAHRSGTESSATAKEEIYTVMQEALRNFTPPMLPALDEVKEELTLAVRDCLEEFRSRGTDTREGARGMDMARDDATRSGSGNLGYSEEVIGSLRDIVDNMRDELKEQSAANGRGAELVLDATRTGLDNLRVAMEAYVDDVRKSAKKDMLASLKTGLADIQDTIHSAARNEDRMTKEMIVAALTAGVAELRAGLGTRELDGSTEDVLDAMKTEFEQLKEGILAGCAIQKDDLMDAIQDGIDSLRGVQMNSQSDHIVESIRAELGKLSSDGQSMNRGELLETIQEAVDNMRVQLSSERSEAADESLGAVRQEIATLSDLLQRTPVSEISATLQAGLASIREDIAKINPAGEIVLADEEPKPDSPFKADFDKMDIALTRILMKIEALDQNQQAPAAMSSVDKEALISMSNSLTEVKAAVVELSSTQANLSREDSSALETLVRKTKAKIDENVIPILDALATRDHLETVEAVLRLTSETVDNLAAKLPNETASKDDVAAMYGLIQDSAETLKELKEAEDARSAELETINTSCQNIEVALQALPTTDEIVDLASKAEIGELSQSFGHFKTVLEDFKQQYETDLEITAQAFDDRKSEAFKILEQLALVKLHVEQSKDELKSRMRRSNEDVRALDEILQGIEDKIDEAPNALPVVEEILALVKEQIEGARQTREESSSNDGKSSERYEELKTTILVELVQKLDERFSSILSRSYEQQEAMSQATQAFVIKAAQQEEATQTSRILHDEIKRTIDMLGLSVADIQPALKEASDDAKTVFTKIEDVHGYMESQHVDFMAGQDLARQDMAKSMSSIEAVHEALMAFQPQAMDALTRLLTAMGEHTEHVKSQPSTLEQMIRSEIAALPRLEAPPSPPVINHDVQIKETLDTMHGDIKAQMSSLSQLADTSKQPVNLEKLDLIHQQVLSTAAEITALVAQQKEQTNLDHVTQMEQARMAAIDAEMFRNEAADLEQRVENLRGTKDSLAADVENLMAERDGLALQKGRLATELSSIETALKIRREELLIMDNRADTLERRIMDRVMDHSRALLMAKQPRALPNMNLKRVTSGNTTASSAIGASNMALRKKPKVATPNDRRILSLNQITGNASPVHPLKMQASNNFKRSQSVKDPLRNTSWAGFDKENSVLSEDDEEQSRATSVTDDASSYDGTVTDRRTSAPSEASYVSGSWASEESSAESERTVSCGSTIRSTVGARSEARTDHTEDELEKESGTLVLHDGSDLLDEDMDKLGELTSPIAKSPLKTGGYDSGLGSSVGSSDYFRDKS